VHTFNLILANDGVGESSAVGEDEDSIRITSLSLSSAADTTSVGLHSTVECPRDRFGGLVGHAALGGRDREAGALLHGEDIVGGRSWGGDRGSGKSQDGGDDGVLHFEGWLSDWLVWNWLKS